MKTLLFIAFIVLFLIVWIWIEFKYAPSLHEDDDGYYYYFYEDDDE